MKYKIGDVVKFNKDNGGYIAIKDYGTIEEILKCGYTVLCHSLEEDIEEHLYFTDNNIKGKKV